MGMSGAERQAAYRARRAARMRELEAAAASHNGAAAPDLAYWLNSAPVEGIATTLVNAVARPERMDAILAAMADVYRSRRKSPIDH